MKNIRTINRLLQEGVLFKISRGIYVGKNPDLWILVSRLREDATISLDSVLAKNALVGTIPEKSVSAVCASGRKREIVTPFGIIRLFSIQKDLLDLGVQRLNNGVRVADNEKATLDLLYYYVKGARFVFDPRNEINFQKLDMKKIKTYLTYYRNPKFVQFVTGLLHENT